MFDSKRLLNIEMHPDDADALAAIIGCGMGAMFALGFLFCKLV